MKPSEVIAPVSENQEGTKVPGYFDPAIHHAGSASQCAGPARLSFIAIGLDASQ